MKMPMAKWICYAVGYVFITTGIVKLLLDDFQTYFNNLDLPFPQTLLLIVALTEIVCGALIAGRFYVKEASVPLIIIMLAAIFLTKLPFLTEQGFFQFLYAARLDIVLLILLLLLWNHVRGQKFS
ncbi:DoxX family protein [Virgibacillus necropolis]|uniref:DoxX family protein n=1 Tax=Virgibacillus necropolis TaxID=163877 RepID=UPI00384D7D72